MAGAQFANMSLFLSQLENEKINKHTKDIINFIDEVCDSQTGAYFINPKPSNRELINGSMKVISGLDWLDEKLNIQKS